MRRRSRSTPWTQAFNRGLAVLTRSTVRAATQATRRVIKASLSPAASPVPSSSQPKRRVTPKKPAVAKARANPSSPRSVPPRPAPGVAGDWIAGAAAGPTGARKFRLYRPPGLLRGERLPVLVMLHGCGQDAQGFADSTRMNAIARRERFLVLYPEQDRFSNPHGCWNWYEMRNGRANAEVAILLLAIDQVCLLHQGDPRRIAVAGLSAGASMAALLASRHPARFCAVVMHSGVGPGAAHSTASALSAMRGQRQPEHEGGPVPLPPLLAIHGGEDRVVSIGNAAAAVRVWTEAAGARLGAPRAVQRGQRYPMTVSTSKRRGQTVATLVEIGALGHAWSGGSSKLPHGDVKGADASRMAWAFVAKTFRSSKAEAA
jgi:poly(hydroxyalkanoate) depolymerase family esterase